MAAAPHGFALALVAGLVGGRLADASDSALVLFAGCMSAGAFLGSIHAWMSDADPDWNRGIGYGTMIGGLVGIVLAVVDASLG